MSGFGVGYASSAHLSKVRDSTFPIAAASSQQEYMCWPAHGVRPGQLVRQYFRSFHQVNRNFCARNPGEHRRPGRTHVCSEHNQPSISP